MLIIGAFGVTLLAVGLLENAGLKVNKGAITFTMTILKFGGILYILNMVSTKFL